MGVKYRNPEVRGSEIQKAQKCVNCTCYQFEVSDYMSTYILSYEKCVGNCGAGVRIFMAQGGMRKIGQSDTYILLLQVHQYTSYIHTYYYYKSTSTHTTYIHTTTGTPVHTLHTYIHTYILLQVHRYIPVHYTTTYTTTNTALVHRNT